MAAIEVIDQDQRFEAIRLQGLCDERQFALKPPQAPLLQAERTDGWLSAAANAQPLRLQRRLPRGANDATGRTAMLGLLLEATLPALIDVCSVLRPLWTDESMQRAYDLVRLIAALERAAPSAAAGQHGLAAEYRIALELAAAYRSLDVLQHPAVVPCSGVLRTATRDFAELFGPAVGLSHVRTSIERLSLPAFQRRALVLAACRLLADMLCRAERPVGAVTISLVRVTPHTACLQVAGGRCVPDDTVAGLACLLDSEPVATVDDAGGVAVELSFPTPNADATGSERSKRRPATPEFHRLFNA